MVDNPITGYFASLLTLFSKLNTIVSFLLLKSSALPTISLLESAIGTHINIEQLAEIKAIFPRGIRLEYTANENTDQQVLVFDVLHNSLTPGRINKPSNATAIQKLITKRRATFERLLKAYLNKCKKSKVDPLIKIKDDSKCFMPNDYNAEVLIETKLSEQNSVPDTIPKKRAPISEIVEQLTHESYYVDQIQAKTIFPAQDPVYEPLGFQLSPTISSALMKYKSISGFYSHQARAINAIVNDKKNAIITTSTASGKSLIYQIPILLALEKDINAKAIFIFPTKALAQDQKRTLQELILHIETLNGKVIVETFDGDTPKNERAYIRENASIIFTNPDMLHMHILPLEKQWRHFLYNLRFVVLDELHIYNNLFGTHVAYIMRRLRRLCAPANYDITYISCSATISNPVQHMSSIFALEDPSLEGNKDVVHISKDGSPTGEKEMILWNSPLKVPNDMLSGRESSIIETARIFISLILRGVRTIVFCRVRTACEGLLQVVIKRLKEIGREEVSSFISGYRGGYSPQDRRKIEKDMFNGRLLGIIATNALELGVDIGVLDAVLIAGFPFTTANVYQQSGRAGRRLNTDSLTILIGDSNPVDQHYMSHSDEILNKKKALNQDLSISLNNKIVLCAHLQCAAFERPVYCALDIRWLAPPLLSDPSDDVFPQLIRDTLVFNPKTGFYHPSQNYLPWPPSKVEIRGVNEEMYAIVDITTSNPMVIEEIEASRTPFTAYEGAIFLHKGKSYLVREVNSDKHMITVIRADVNYFTTQRDYTDVDPLEIEVIKPICSRAKDSKKSKSVDLLHIDPSSIISKYAYYGKIEISYCVFGYYKMDSRGKIFDSVDVVHPPVIHHSRGFWIDIPSAALDLLREKKLNVAGAIHAAEHAIISLFPVYVTCMSREEKQQYLVNSMQSNGRKQQFQPEKDLPFLNSADDSRDVRTECKAPEKEFSKRETNRKRPARLVFYDSNAIPLVKLPRNINKFQNKKTSKDNDSSESNLKSICNEGDLGSGVCAHAFDYLDSLLTSSLERVEQCPCELGCPECVVSPSCKEHAVVISKAGARIVLRSILGKNLYPGILPENDHEIETPQEDSTRDATQSNVYEEWSAPISDGPEKNLPKDVQERAASGHPIETVIPVTSLVTRAPDIKIIGTRTIATLVKNEGIYKKVRLSTPVLDIKDEEEHDAILRIINNDIN